MSGYPSRAAELRRARPLGFRARRAARRAALTVLRGIPRSAEPGVRIVHYHYVFDDEVESFARQLSFLADEHEPVSLGEAVDRLRADRVSGRELAVTFDDGFRNQLVNAAPVLGEHGFRACFFLVTELVGASPPTVEQFCRDRLHLPLPVEPLSWDDAGRLLELGHEIGSHTRSHSNLADLGTTELAAELTGSREELERRLGQPVLHLSAPYGDRERFSSAVSAAAYGAGYESCATAQRGLNTTAEDVFALKRHHLEASWPVADVRYFLSQ